ncbi:substrate-binding domain-containing protein [Mesobacillus harenae]|uniref:substrate-binding domain-containing protein n=1 Tax=Mesobacillus harenae TaxID=2213203 RepID=UPI00157FDDB4|nr:substrate-binding domain-containing protein [Mesobacillus harenae]
MKKMILVSLFAIIIVLSASACSNSTKSQPTEKAAAVEKTDLILATTTSTQDSGLLDVLLPKFESEAPYNVKTIAVGTGQALEMGTRGEADVLLVHAPEAEQQIIDSRDAINRQRVMYNDFIIVGPEEDPAQIRGLPVEGAILKIASSDIPFISRGDDSGTHKKELQLWNMAGIEPASVTSYIETGQGMGSTLQIASEKNGYALTDRATFLAQRDNLNGLSIVSEGDNTLLNIYHVMQVNENKHEKINSNGAKAFVEFMTAAETQSIIAEFGQDLYGEALFFSYTE